MNLLDLSKIVPRKVGLEVDMKAKYLGTAQRERER